MAQTPVIEEIKDVIVPDLIAYNLHVKKLGAGIGHKVKLIVFCESFKACVLSAADYRHNVIV